MTLEEIKLLRESEDKVEFKEAKNNFPWNGGKNTEQKERRKCFLGYIVGLANEGGGKLIFGMDDKYPHNVVGTNFAEDKVGELEDAVYKELQVRVRINELYENELRVLVTTVPSRPIGKPLKFEGVPLMRIGDSLRNMSDEELFAVLSEQEPDFSAKICNHISIEDLDESAIKVLKDSYAKKQNNPSFNQLSNQQVLSDLKLSTSDGLSYATLILLGKTEIIEKYIPQSKTIWEYRNSDSQIHHDTRIVIEGPLFLAIDQIWKLINQPSLNRKHPIQSGAFIFDIYDFNEQVIREAILNAIAHRDYSMTSEVVIKQYPSKIQIINPGGFPKGVNLENLLTVSSTPRSRLMTEVLEKTGLVERSGQGVDKIFSITLSEGKDDPDYNSSDMYQVSLVLKNEIIDRAFHIFINQYQTSDREPKLGVEQIIHLCKIRKGIFQNLNKDIIEQLEDLALIKRVSGHSYKFVLNDEFYSLEDQEQGIGKRYLINEVVDLIFCLQGNELKIGEIEQRLIESLNRNQIKHLINKLKEDHIISTSGVLKGTKYSLSEEYKDLRGDLLKHTVIKCLKQLYEVG